MLLQKLKWMSIKADSIQILVIELNECQILMQVWINFDELFSINVMADAFWNLSQYSREGLGLKFSPKNLHRVDIALGPRSESTEPISPFKREPKEQNVTIIFAITPAWHSVQCCTDIPLLYIHFIRSQLIDDTSHVVPFRDIPFLLSLSQCKM